MQRRGRSGDGPSEVDEAMLNPLRSEGEAFRLVIYVVVVMAVLVAVVLIVRALT